MASIPSFSPNLGDSRHSSLCYPKRTVTTNTTAAAVTFGVADLLGGLILRNPSGAGRADLFPTAAAIVAAINGVWPSLSFEFVVRNTATAAETITATTNVGLTLSGTMTIAQNNSKLFYAIVTNSTPGSEAVTIYSIGSFVH